MDYSKIQPSQLFINTEKLELIENNLRKNEEIEPVPIKKIGNILFFTDGHTRAYALYKNGHKKIPVYWDEDKLDWFSYYICIDWCQRKGIYYISHLDNSIIPKLSYEEKWHKLCDEMHKNLKLNPEHYINAIIETNPEVKTSFCDYILHELPEWFGIESAIQGYNKGVRENLFITICIGRIPVGFLSIIEHNEFCSEVYVMGILREFHGKGMGKSLIDFTSEYLKRNNKRFLTVKTLSGSHPDTNYKKTRNFYISSGFYPLEEFKTLWDEENPCLFLIKIL